MALRIFSKWIDLYAGTDENHYADLVALLNLHDIRHKATSHRTSSRMATYAGAAGCAPTNTTMTRIGYVNPALVSAMQDADEEAQKPLRYRVRIRACDFLRVQQLQSSFVS